MFTATRNSDSHGAISSGTADLGVKRCLFGESLKDLLATLKDLQIYDVLVEAGATLSTAFLQERLVDEMISYVAPTFRTISTCHVQCRIWHNNFVLSL